MPFRIDLHTHSIASKDGGITLDQYQAVMLNDKLDSVAITDHNRIDFAKNAQKTLGKDRIIIGEEITTNQGDIIGLFLTSLVQPNQDIIRTIQDIKSQGGLVYIPHPFETIRSGVDEKTLNSAAKHVDIVESANGRALFQNFGPKSHVWARKHHKVACASSDAHRANALGKTLTTVDILPTKTNLVKQLASARLSYVRPSLSDVLAPKLNKLTKFLKLRSKPTL